MKPQVQLEADGKVGRSRIDDNEWEFFIDPEANPEWASHMTTPVKTQFLGESWEKGPWIVPNRFEPNVKADPHSHGYDTIYYILSGTMSFNDGSGWYEAGDLRWVRAGLEYGPEESGPDGCDFLLISYGPVVTEWQGGDTHAPELSQAG
jgi:mannose-6-phosphate isomerase-like protein (cupin superfamily)